MKMFTGPPALRFACGFITISLIMGYACVSVGWPWYAAPVTVAGFLAGILLIGITVSGLFDLIDPFDQDQGDEDE